MPVPDFSPGEILTSAAMDSIGLWRVTTCTVTSAGGTAATASNGVITVGSGNTSVTISNAFSSNFDAYQIIASGVSASATGTAKFQLSGLTTGYFGNLIYANNAGGAVLSAGYNNAAEITHAGGTDSSILMFDMKVINPFLTKPTYMISTFNERNNAGPVTAMQNSSTSVTGFTITLASGTITGGQIRVYGYTK